MVCVYSIAVMFNGLEHIDTWDSNTCSPQKFWVDQLLGIFSNSPLSISQLVFAFASRLFISESRNITGCSRCDFNHIFFIFLTQ